VKSGKTIEKGILFHKGFIKIISCSISFIFLCVSFTFALSAADKPFYTYYNFLSGTKSLSMGNAFVGIADDLTATYCNPAGITKFQAPSFFANFKTDSVHYDYESQSKNFATYSQEYDYNFTSKLKEINFLSISVPVVFWEVKWNLALSYYRYFPYGCKGNSQTTLTTLNGGKNIDKTITGFSGSRGIDVLGFTTAFDLTKYVAFGFTLQQFFNTGTIRFDSLPEKPSCKDPTYNENIEGRNFIFGLLLNVHQDVSIGLSYHTKLTNNFHSGFQCREDAGGKQETTSLSEVTIPNKFALGTGIRLLPSFIVSYEFSRIYWSQGKIGDLPFPVREDFSFSQTDIINHRFGMEYSAPVRQVNIYMRAGLSWDRQLFRGGDSANVTVKGYAMGFGIFFQPGLMLDLAYMHQRAKWLEPGFFDPQSYIGASYRNNILSASLTYYFGLKKQKSR
jgi:long-subunit fatty acid transport protein